MVAASEFSFPSVFMAGVRCCNSEGADLHLTPNAAALALGNLGDAYHDSSRSSLRQGLCHSNSRGPHKKEPLWSDLHS